MKKKYFANYHVNNGTTKIHDDEYTNKREAAKNILSTAKAECFDGNRGHCWVCDENGKIVFSRFTYNGRTWFNDGSEGEFIK